jgi:hypothetical protein
MLKNASKDQKRYALVQECMKATDCKKRDAEAVYKELPEELRSQRGRPIRNPKPSPAVVSSTEVDASGEATCGSAAPPIAEDAVDARGEHVSTPADNASDDERSEAPSQS